jgi:hypothetical protein
MARRNPLLGALLLPGMVFFSTQLQALPYSVMDSYSFSMGGTGVASGTRGNAIFYNPALLAASEMPQNYSLHAPVLGARFYDRNKVLEELDKYQYLGLEANFDEALTAYSTDVGALQDVADATSSLGQQLLTLAGDPMQREYFGAVVLGIPHQRLGISLTLNTRVVGGAEVNVVQNDLDELQRILTATREVNLSQAEAFRSNDLESRLLGRGLVISEVGLALAQDMDVFGHEISVGVTPKYRQVTSFDYASELNSADFEIDLGEKDHSAFDVDIGAAKHYGNGWSTGVAIKNLIGQEYNTVRGNTIKIGPQVRLGAAHSTPYTRVAVDLDVNESRSTGFDSNSRYIAVGAELNVFDMTRVRIGYRHNMSDTNTSIATFGMGFDVYGAELDLAAGANEDELGYSAQLGFEF